MSKPTILTDSVVITMVGNDVPLPCIERGSRNALSITSTATANDTNELVQIFTEDVEKLKGERQAGRTLLGRPGTSLAAWRLLL